MIRLFLILLAIVLLSSCSSSKYTHNSGHYDYNSGRKKTYVDTTLPNETFNGDKNPLTLDNTSLVASTDKKLVVSEKLVSDKENKVNSSNTSELARNYREISKNQRKEFRRAMRQNMRRCLMPSKKFKSAGSMQ